MPTTGKRGSPGCEVSRIPYDGHPGVLPAKELVGSKAHNLMRIARCGLPVPSGFVFPTQLCRDFMARGPAALAGIEGALARELDHLASLTGRTFGDDRRPLLLSVRSGAAVSMPGMMETVLNIGLTSETLKGLVRMTGNPRLGQDCRRRLIQQYGEVVYGIPHTGFDTRMRTLLADLGAADIDELDTAGLKRLADSFDGEFITRTGTALPEAPMAQLRTAIEAVLRSWTSERAKIYRRLNDIPESIGTAVTVQAMVFGNMGPDSGAGVGFTRNPADGTDELYIDFLANAQGEDVVAGRRRAMGLDELARRAPGACQELTDARELLEREFNDMQDFEYTVEEGRLLLLQSRRGNRTALAALRIVCDQVRENLIQPTEALARLENLDLDAIKLTKLTPPSGVTPAATGMPAGLGVAVGAVTFDPGRLAHIKRKHPSVILMLSNAETNDIATLAEAAALVTVEGARTSHAAVVARQLEKPCIVACGGFRIDPDGLRGRLGGEPIMEGDVISLDGSTGEIFRGEQKIVTERPTDLLEMVRQWQKELQAG